MAKPAYFELFLFPKVISNKKGFLEIGLDLVFINDKIINLKWPKRTTFIRENNTQCGSGLSVYLSIQPTDQLHIFCQLKALYMPNFPLYSRHNSTLWLRKNDWPKVSQVTFVSEEGLELTVYF